MTVAGERTDDDVRLVAAENYLAAHAAMRRSAEQTSTIAERLHRGEKVYESQSSNTS